MIIFSYFSLKPYVVTPHLNHLIETGFQNQKFGNKLLVHDNQRISFALNREVYSVYIADRSWVSMIYSCLRNSHIPYLKANSIFRKSRV